MARVRFAPSPTGFLHVGGARTALFNYLFARKEKGSFVLRIEDTDKERCSPDFETAIIEDLRWMGLLWDEGPMRQSERLDIYRERAASLLENGLAYRCYCSKERLARLKDSQLSQGMAPRYDGRCKGMTTADGPFSIRFAVPPGKISFDDLVHGRLEFDKEAIGDFIIMGSDDVATYNFAATVDDSIMGITHVIRGDDHISNTPRQMLLMEAMGFEPPCYCHIPLITSMDKTPLAKREGSLSIRALKEEYLPQALVNALSRLGWSPPEGLFALEELAGFFDLKRLSKSPSIFDMERLKSYNREALGKADPASLVKALRLKGIPGERLGELAAELGREASTLKELKDLVVSIAQGPVMAKDALALLHEPYAKAVLKAFVEEYEKTDAIGDAAYEAVMRLVEARTNERGKRLFMPMRAGLIGRTHGVELKKVVRLLGKEETMKRLKPLTA